MWPRRRTAKLPSLRGTVSPASAVAAPAAASTGAVSGLQKRPSTATAANTRPASGNFLEMPLSSGAVVTTTVPQRAPAASAQRRTTPRAPHLLRQRLRRLLPRVRRRLLPRKPLFPRRRPLRFLLPPLLFPASRRLRYRGTAADMEQASREAIAQEELDFAARMLQQAREEMSSRPLYSSVRGRDGRFRSVRCRPTARLTRMIIARAWSGSRPIPRILRFIRKSATAVSVLPISGMIFESAYTTLRRNIPWMMSDKVRVFVYQDHNSYLKTRTQVPKAWTRALAYPTRGEIVVYDEPRQTAGTQRSVYA